MSTLSQLTQFSQKISLPSDVHAVTIEILNKLMEINANPDVFVHEAVRTSEEAAKVRTGYSLSQGAKALILRIKKSKNDKFFCMLVVPGDAQFDKKKVQELFEAKDIRFATTQEVSELTKGVLPGGIPPLGNLFGLQTFVDKSVLKNDRIIFNAGDKRVSLGISIEEYNQISNFQISDLLK